MSQKIEISFSKLKFYSLIAFGVLLVTAYVGEAYQPYKVANNVISAGAAQISGHSNQTKVSTAPKSKSSAPSKQGYITHIVSSGETLSSISRWYHVHVELIRMENNISSNSVIKPGQTLLIPEVKQG